MEKKLEPIQDLVGLAEGDCVSEDEGRLYVKMPPLSDRCGGSHDETLLMPIPEGIDLPEGIQIVKGDGIL